jgi:PTS system nitrogen regulatory IIA component
VERPTVSLCLLRDPVEFDAIDGLPVHALFVVVSSDIPTHLGILARLGFVLRDEQLRRLLRDAASTGALLARVQALEASSGSADAGAGPRRSSS